MVGVGVISLLGLACWALRPASPAYYSQQRQPGRSQEEYVDRWLPLLHSTVCCTTVLSRRGIRVIVGHYRGEEAGANLSRAELDRNGYRAEEGAGEAGRPVQEAQHSRHARNLVQTKPAGFLSYDC